MRAAVWRGSGQVRWEERPAPAVVPDRVAVRPEVTGLCGTDMAIFGGRHGRANPPLVMGHEFVGVLTSSRVGAPEVGTRVAVNPLLACGMCWSCHHGFSHTCTRLRLIGIDEDGSLADSVAVPTESVFPLSAATSPATAVFVEPLAVAIHAVAQAALSPGEPVLVLGGGPIGILTALVAQSEGAGDVLVVEPNQARRTALPPVLSTVTRPQGVIVVAGLHHQPAAVDLHAITFTEQRIIGSRVYTNADFAAAVAAVESGRYPVHRLPVAVFPLHRTAAAFAEAGQNPRVLKVVVEGRPEAQSL